MRKVMLSVTVILVVSVSAFFVYISALTDTAGKLDAQGKYEQEIQVLKKLVAINAYMGTINIVPAMPHVYLMLGYAYSRLGRYSESKENLEKAIALYDKDEQYKNMAVVARSVLENISRRAR